MKSHKEFMEDVAHATSLPAQTCRALGPESQEDISMYANCETSETGGKNGNNNY
jgi:hypothetical protein